MTDIVKAGDSAIHLARDSGVDVDALLAANSVKNRNLEATGEVVSGVDLVRTESQASV